MSKKKLNIESLRLKLSNERTINQELILLATIISNLTTDKEVISELSQLVERMKNAN